MAFNIVIENMIKSRKGEQASIHESCQLCAEIEDINTSQPILAPEWDSEKNLSAESSPVDDEEMYLLEKALVKALQIRTVSKPSVTRPNIVKPPRNHDEHDASTKDTLSTFKGMTKSKLMCQKKIKKYQPTVWHSSTNQADGLKFVRTDDPKITHGNMTSSKLKALPDHEKHTLPHGSRNQMVKTGQLCGKNLNIITDFSKKNSVSFSNTMKSETNCLFQPEEIYKWTNLKHKKNRLWEKIIDFETKSSTSSRDFFMERMRGTMPTRWPYGSPEKINVLLHRLMQGGQDLLKNQQTGDIVAEQTPEDNVTQGGGKDSHETALNFDSLKMTPNNIHECVVLLEKEWESWDRWRPEWGCLCSIGTERQWHEGRPAPLPKTVTYTTERELTELETLRMRVALLQQEAFVEKILSDTLSPYISSASNATLNPFSLLRDLYSVLGEGGERFPAIVLDSEPDS